MRVYFRASFPRKQIGGQGSRSVPEVIFALTKRSPRFWVRLNARIGVQRKIPRRSWLLNKNGNKGFELDSLMITYFYFTVATLPPIMRSAARI